MEPPREPRGKEREDTDASLRAERTKADLELDKSRARHEAGTDRLISDARERTRVTLEAARERADHELVDASQDVRNEMNAERDSEDRTSAQERAAEDERLHVEREERQRALSALLRLEREATNERLFVERSSADAAIRSRDDFLGMVSHDLRTMLGGIALNATLLARNAAAAGDSARTTLQRAERIQRFTARMNRLVGDLLDVLSLEAGHLQVNPQPDDTIRLVREALDAFDPSFAAKGVSLTTNLQDGVVLAKCDHERILQVLANLLSNALKFTNAGGRATLVVAPLGEEVRFTVTDTGVGIPSGQTTAIFERFQQLSTSDRRGVGLGLYISKCIVEAHGGRIWAESPVGSGGTAVHFTLPRAACV